MNQLKTELLRYNDVIRLTPNDSIAYVKRGMIYFKLAQIDESIQDFDRAATLDPLLTPYLWQRGLSYYYAGRYEEGAEQFTVDLTVNPHDAEETIWCYLCMACWQGVSAARDALLVVEKEPRLIVRAIYELYAGRATVEEVLKSGSTDRDRFYSHLYVGLYYEAAGEKKRSRNHIAQAVASFKLTDYMWHVARVHQQLREDHSPVAEP